MSSFIPGPPNSAWQQPIDLFNEDLLEQEEVAYEEEIKANYHLEVQFSYGIECREDNCQDDEIEEPEEYDVPSRQGDRDDDGVDPQQ